LSLPASTKIGIQRQSFLRIMLYYHQKRLKLCLCLCSEAVHLSTLWLINFFLITSSAMQQLAGWERRKLIIIFKN
jgi:hypothetical protein